MGGEVGVSGVSGVSGESCESNVSGKSGERGKRSESGTSRARSVFGERTSTAARSGRSRSCGCARAACARAFVSVVLAAAFVSAFTLPSGAQSVCTPSPTNPTATFTTTLGDIEVLLCRADAPQTVQNFVQYVNDGAYTDSGFVHRSVQEDFFIVQGGGAWIDTGGVMRLVETRAPIPFEVTADLPNLRGTIAMARSDALDTATSQWFFNVQDNPVFDPTFQTPLPPPPTPPTPTGGYAVFGEVTAGLSVLDAMAAQTTWALNTNFLSEVPLIGYPDDGSSPLPFLVYVTDVQVVPEPGAFTQALAAVATLACLARARRWRRRLL